MFCRFNTFKNMKKIDYWGMVILALSPIIVNIILGIPAICTVNGDTNGWLGFYGSFVGAIIPMFILYRTRQWNKGDNDKTRNMQYNVLQYQAKKVWFEQFKKQLDENYRLLDFQAIAIVINNIILEHYQIALNYLMQLNRNIEMQSHSFDLCLGKIEAYNPTEQKYVNCYNALLKEYGTLVNDLILICNIGNIIQHGGDYLKYVRESYKLLNNVHEEDNIVEVSLFLEKINEMVCDEKSISEITDACNNRMADTVDVQKRKKELIDATRNLLSAKEQEIENILKRTTRQTNCILRP